MLAVTDLYKRFGPVKVINGIQVAVAAGQRHAIIGPNGAGKTTLFHLISGTYAPDRGAIVFDGQPIAGLPPHRINRLGLSRSFQITNIFAGLSVHENIRAAVLSRHGIRFDFFRRAGRMAAVNREAAAILEQIGLADRAGRLAGELAYGQQRALEIGITLASEPKMILLDEPTAGMSIDETREAVRLIDRVTRGKTLLIIEHDMEVVFSLADVITVLHYGEILASGPPAEIRADPNVRQAYLGGH
jgi:branched-chain amino acid transport system ATP-binding protein